MKRIIFITALLITVSEIGNAHHNFQVSAHFGVFYSSLAGYGEWVESDWGSAWRPLHVVHGWRPYMDGRWIWTDFGWYWVSYEPFGWATFHYGRWQYDDYYGWIWIPDDVWGPAWVQWRYDDDYIGWAPLPTSAVFRVNIGVTFVNDWVAPIYYWNFIPCRNFTSARIIDYVQPIDRVRRIYGSTREGTMIRGHEDRVINRGVDINFVEHRTNTRISRVDVIQRDRGDGDRIIRDGRNERIEVYRPRFDNQSNNDRSQIPSVRRRDQEVQRELPKENREDRNIRQREDTQRPLGRDTERPRGIVREKQQKERQVEQRREIQRERPMWDVQRRNNVERQQHEQIQQRRQEQRNIDQQRNSIREMHRNDQFQQQNRELKRERPRQSQVSPESRRNEDRKRRP